MPEAKTVFPREDEKMPEGGKTSRRKPMCAPRGRRAQDGPLCQSPGASAAKNPAKEVLPEAVFLFLKSAGRSGIVRKTVRERGKIRKRQFFGADGRRKAASGDGGGGERLVDAEAGGEGVGERFAPLEERRLHDGDPEGMPDRAMREVQAESVAYAVSAALGLDTSGYSFGYVASWAVGKTDEEMRACLQVVRDAAKAMVEDLQAAMA